MRIIKILVLIFLLSNSVCAEGLSSKQSYNLEYFKVTAVKSKVREIQLIPKTLIIKNGDCFK